MRAARLTLVRGERTTGGPVLAIEFTNGAADKPASEGFLSLEAGEPGRAASSDRLDAWALAVCEAAENATGGGTA
jgi:hypothetical protein